jgi:CCR4-NOT transcription complex subunit 1
MSPADAKYFTEIRNLSYQLHPRLMNLTPGSDAEPGLAVVGFSADVETEVETIYRRMYDGDISIDQVIEMLRESKNSSVAREKEIFACTLHSLFDEYKFFQSSYPARELAMTGYLFGSIIQYHLIDYIPLGIAIRYVLDAIRSPPETNLFTFGIEALMRFESRLLEWPPLCNTLLRIPHLHTARPDIADVVRRALARSDSTNAGDGGEHPDEKGIHLPGLEPAALAFTAIQADDMSSEPLTEPLPEESEKILFIINNLAQNNFESKLEEMKERFKAEQSRWFANYLVDQRVSTEPNNHQIYLRFLDGLENRILHQHVLNETLFKSSILLNADSKPVQASSERTTLKNLGSWLGAITLARNRAIKHRHLSFKDLLLEGYDGNRLLKGIPFVCKILEQCTKSTVFTPPNPWLMAVLSLLAELYHFADLRLNLKFEIEVLCKSLNVDLDKLEPTTLLRERASTADTGPPLPEFVPDIDQLPISNYDPALQPPGDAPQHSGQVLQLSSSSPTQSQQLIATHIEAIISDIPNHVTINAQLASLALSPGFKRVIQMAVERAVREVSLVYPPIYSVNEIS